MIEILNKKDCCGCTACEQVCPTNCISMLFDDEGFLYPSVNTEMCISCNLCVKVCPILNKKKSKKTDVEAYAAYTDNDEIRLKSSSGGLFTIFANQIFNQGGMVAGAAFDNEFMVEHIVIESNEELNKLQGSKYLQSNMKNSLKEVKTYLDQNTKVLFTGTACQIEGLKRYLRKEYSNLYTIDVLCHGVPSPKVWKKYLSEKELEYGSKLQQTFFRKKDFGWKRFALSLKYKDKAYLKNHHDDPFMKLFLNEICLRPSCHDCKFKDFPRESDLTIGDAWGIENHMSDMDDDKGTSVLITNSKKGNELLSSVRKKLVIKEAELDVILPATADSRKSVIPHKNRELFFKELDQKNINQLCKYIEKPIYQKVYQKVRRKIERIIVKLKENDI
ncbi:MAG: 4Fe-4S binding protein [Erysipelotrichaceae bacterium]|nr:4Fe-4S binding protein [Erysipelotrichaceae bacterium]